MERVATLWIGERFSFLEHLCLKSFADLDQKPIVYHYGDLKDIPGYVEARDAREVFDAPEIYRDPITRSVAVHADLFRLKLLQQTDQIWVDADAYAVKPFQTDQGYLFPAANRRRQRIMNGVLALPGDSPALAEMCAFAFDSDLVPPWWPEEQQRAYLQIFGRSTYWSLPIFSFGPPMLFHYLYPTPEHAKAVSRKSLYAIPLRHRSLWNEPDQGKLEFLDWQNQTSVHFYGSWFRKIFKDRAINPGSLVDTLLRKHGIDPNDHPI
ncbi:hypothetical protein SAMN05444279_10511 [Ruegeria intermedia]|uniref:Alpha 1,4-glycosyltransferase conserved region n=1 Tax=Ruegeria intermedia TaxID=996115 RepID=A0A1M4UVA4_9RHOB|nr:hypothetical protein [Ruegeria intermedia]SHE60701.1 hypothetical protein SAMN05444279_10511 [Ruegeria intermedia]